MSDSIPNRYDRWLNRERDSRRVENAFAELDRQADYLADSTHFGPALRFYLDGLCGAILKWPRS